MNRFLNLFFVFVFTVQISFANSESCTDALESNSSSERQLSSNQFNIDLESIWNDAMENGDLKGIHFLIQLIDRSSLSDLDKELASELRNLFNKKYSEGNTILHMAAKHDDIDILSFMIDHGADITSENDLNETPYDVAKYYENQFSIDALETAMNEMHEIGTLEQEKGKNKGIVQTFQGSEPISKVDGHLESYIEEQTQLAESVKNRIIQHIKNRDLMRLKFLFEYLRKNNLDIILENTKHIYITKSYKTTFLIMAARLDDVDIVEFLLDDKYQNTVLEKDSLDKSVLHVAANNGSARITETILDSMEDEDTLYSLVSLKEKKTGNTVLHNVVINDQFNLLSIMLNRLKSVLTEISYNKLLQIRNNESKTVEDLMRDKKIPSKIIIELNNKPINIQTMYADYKREERAAKQIAEVDIKVLKRKLNYELKFKGRKVRRIFQSFNKVETKPLFRYSFFTNIFWKIPVSIILSPIVATLAVLASPWLTYYQFFYHRVSKNNRTYKISDLVKIKPDPPDLLSDIN